MLQLAVRHQASLHKFLFVVHVEHVLHLGPEAFLPLEHGLLGDHVRHDAAGQTAGEEVVGEVLNVVQGVVVSHHHVGLVLQNAVVAEDGLAAVLREEGGDQAAGSDGLPSSSVLTTNSVALRSEFTRKD